MLQFLAAGFLEHRHAGAQWRHAREDALDRFVLTRGVHSLYDDQQGPGFVGKQEILGALKSIARLVDALTSFLLICKFAGVFRVKVG